MDEELKVAVDYWNNFVDCMIAAKTAWEEINELALEGLNTEEAPVLFQKLISMFGKAKFTVAVPRMIDWIRMYSNWEEALVPVEEDMSLEPEIPSEIVKKAIE